MSLLIRFILAPLLSAAAAGGAALATEPSEATIAAMKKAMAQAVGAELAGSGGARRNLRPAPGRQPAPAVATTSATHAPLTGRGAQPAAAAAPAPGEHVVLNLPTQPRAPLTRTQRGGPITPPVRAAAAPATPGESNYGRLPPPQEHYSSSPLLSTTSSVYTAAPPEHPIYGSGPPEIPPGEYGEFPPEVLEHHQ